MRLPGRAKRGQGNKSGTGFMRATEFCGGGLPTVLLLVGVLGGPVTARGTSTQGGMIWSLESDGSWSSTVVSLGGNGTRAITQVDATSGAYVVFNDQPQAPPVPIMEQAIPNLALNVLVDSATEGDRHVSAHQRKSESNASKWRTVLAGYDSGGRLWEYMFPIETGLYPGSGVAISKGGALAVGALWDIGVYRTTVVTIDAQTGSLNQVHLLPPDGRLLDMALSGDGSTLVMVSTMKMVILDLASGALLLNQTIPGQPSFGALDISEDGSVVAFGTTERISIYRGGSGSYGLDTSYSLPSGSAGRRLSLSPDGTRLACGLLFSSSTPLVDIRAYNLNIGGMTMHFESTVPGTLKNTINAIDITDDGSRFAVGMYGDEQHSLPEILVFNVDNDQPVLTIDRPGSILDLDMSGDGTRLAATTKGEHVDINGGLGSVDLFDISTDSAPAGFSYVGQPSLGSVIRFEHDLEGGNYGRVLASEFLDPNPTVFGSIGTLYLNRSRLDVLPLGALNNSGQMVTPFQVQGVQAGATLYFQALAVGPRKLTENYIELTVLP